MMHTAFSGRDRLQKQTASHYCMPDKGDMALDSVYRWLHMARKTAFILGKIPARFAMVALSFLPAIPGTAQPATESGGRVVREYFEATERLRMSALLEQFGGNKELPPGYELQTLLALSHYPQLRDIKIRFIVDDVSIPLSSRPHWATVVRSANQRTYLVVIDNSLDGPRSALLLQNQPFNAQIGIIGHELAHTVYYLERSAFGILGDALCQLTSCRIEFERDTDKRLIEYGLGWQRYDHAVFLRSRFAGDNAPASELEGGGGAYMGPRALLSLMENHAAYAD